MDQTIRDWEMRLRGTERKSERTIAAYLWNMRRLANAYPGKAAADFKRRDLEHFLNEQSLAGWSDATARQALSAFRKFFRYVCGKRSPAETLPFPPRSKPKRKTRSLTKAQAGEVLAVFESLTPVGRRDLAILAVMLDTGVRAAELCRMRVADVSLAERTFEVVAKGGRVRRGLLSPATVALVSAWLGTRDGLAQPQVKTVFVSVGGKTPGQALTTRGLREMLRRAGQRAGLEALAPHDLRRTFAHLALRAGASTRVLQAGGGWERLQQVEVYSREIALEDFEAFLPMARLMA